jgi:hypothetical protein
MSQAYNAGRPLRSGSVNREYHEAVVKRLEDENAALRAALAVAPTTAQPVAVRDERLNKENADKAYIYDRVRRDLMAWRRELLGSTTDSHAMDHLIVVHHEVTKRLAALPATAQPAAWQAGPPDRVGHPRAGRTRRSPAPERTSASTPRRRVIAKVFGTDDGRSVVDALATAAPPATAVSAARLGAGRRTWVTKRARRVGASRVIAAGRASAHTRTSGTKRTATRPRRAHLPRCTCAWKVPDVRCRWHATAPAPTRAPASEAHRAPSANRATWTTTGAASGAVAACGRRRAALTSRVARPVPVVLRHDEEQRDAGAASSPERSES